MCHGMPLYTAYGSRPEHEARFHRLDPEPRDRQPSSRSVSHTVTVSQTLSLLFAGFARCPSSQAQGPRRREPQRGYPGRTGLRLPAALGTEQTWSSECPSDPRVSRNLWECKAEAERHSYASDESSGHAQIPEDGRGVFRVICDQRSRCNWLHREQQRCDHRVQGCDHRSERSVLMSRVVRV